MTSVRSTFVAVSCSVLAACAAPVGGGSADSGAFDASGSDADAATPLNDAGGSDAGAAEPVADSGTAGDAGGTQPGDAGLGAPDGGRFSYTVLDAGVLMFNNAPWPYQLLRFEVEGHQPSYGQYFPPPDGGVGAVVLVAQPYASAAWTGEEVDSRWASKAPVYGQYSDTDGPYADGGELIVYQPMTLDEGLSQAFIYLYHGVGVLHVFERFYAGDSIQNDVDDTVAGFRFLAQAPEVRPGAVGVFGGSWGGFEAVYGAMRAPPEARPVVGAVLYPLTDFEQQVSYLNHLDGRLTSPAKRDAMRHFFAPYLRRISLTTDAQGFTEWNASAVAANLKTPMAIIHDSFDMLVPYQQTQALVDANVGVDGFIVPHASPPSWDTYDAKHYPVQEAETSDVSLTLSLSHLLLALVPAPNTVLVPVNQTTFNLFMAEQHAAQRADGGHPSSERAYARRLAELADPRVWVFQPNTSFQAWGPQYVADRVNTEWGTHSTSVNIRAALANGLPPP